VRHAPIETNTRATTNPSNWTPLFPFAAHTQVESTSSQPKHPSKNSESYFNEKLVKATASTFVFSVSAVIPKQRSSKEFFKISKNLSVLTEFNIEEKANIQLMLVPKVD